ncbi:hypothetical protein Acr_18g0009060 [Actinidia rufa]|uniref:Reverse transcriptase domain-containing protein n=1 Tax=Actinidia rufa TaxID=165716 RepID=A0A7J0G7G3_9ERIC|nr:hypothetical protein Acr_18g0009060 [Actinidia rufa]
MKLRTSSSVHCSNLGLADTPFSGAFLTWTNNTTWCKLDRALVNNNWIMEGLRAHANFDFPGKLSDHSPCIVSLFESSAQGPKPFTFFNMWALHEDFQAAGEDKLCEIQQQLHDNPSNTLLQEQLVESKVSALRLAEAERSFCSQLAKVKFLKENPPPSIRSIIHSWIFIRVFLAQVLPDQLDNPTLLDGEQLLKQINHSIIALVPKNKSASRVEDYRPIACCNVSYKVISTILAARLAPVMTKLNDPAQFAFVQGRAIVENVFLVQELIKRYGWSRIFPRCTLKVDLRKAFDIINWNFMKDVLKGLGFPSLFVEWIMQCVTTTSYSLSINGSLHGFFKGKQGVRQGDLISSFPFVLCLEYLSRSLKDLKDNGDFNYHPMWLKMSLQKSSIYATGMALSYAGRCKLIRSVLQGVECFWLSSLPILVGAAKIKVDQCVINGKFNSKAAYEFFRPRKLPLTWPNLFLLLLHAALVVGSIAAVILLVFKGLLLLDFAVAAPVMTQSSAFSSVCNSLLLFVSFAVEMDGC